MSINKIEQYYPQYFENSDDLCFKTCYYDNDNNDYIVVLHKLPDTITNESRPDIINPLYAKFRGNKFMVLKIFSKIDPLKTINEIKNSVFEKTTLTYKTGEEVSVDDFDDKLEKVCSRGIHYFKSVEAAFYYGKIPSNYSGKWIRYRDNGNKVIDEEYLNVEQFRKLIFYYDNENKVINKKYLNSKKICKLIFYYENGNKEREEEYLNGKRHGKWTYYYKNGNKKEEGKYLNGKRHGKWISYYENGNIIEK